MRTFLHRHPEICRDLVRWGYELELLTSLERASTLEVPFPPLFDLKYLKEFQEFCQVKAIIYRNEQPIIRLHTLVCTFAQGRDLYYRELPNEGQRARGEFTRRYLRIIKELTTLGIATEWDLINQGTKFYSCDTYYEIILNWVFRPKTGFVISELLEDIGLSRATERDIHPGILLQFNKGDLLILSKITVNTQHCFPTKYLQDQVAEIRRRYPIKDRI